MANKLQRARQKQDALIPAAEIQPSVLGKFIAHEQPPEVVEAESRMAEAGNSLSDLRGRVSLLYMAYRDMKHWLRSVESYLNFDARYGAMEFFKQRLEDIDTKISNVEKDIKETNRRLDDALKEE